MYVKFFRVRKIFCTQGFAGFTVFSFCLCLKLLFRKCAIGAVRRCFIKTCSLTGCQQALLFKSMEWYLVGQMFNNSMFNSTLDELKEVKYFN